MPALFQSIFTSMVVETHWFVFQCNRQNGDSICKITIEFSCINTMNRLIFILFNHTKIICFSFIVKKQNFTGTYKPEQISQHKWPKVRECVYLNTIVDLRMMSSCHRHTHDECSHTNTYEYGASHGLGPPHAYTNTHTHNHQTPLCMCLRFSQNILFL